MRGIVECDGKAVVEALPPGGLPDASGVYVVSFVPKAVDTRFQDDWSFMGGEVAWYVGLAENIDGRWEQHRKKLTAMDANAMAKVRNGQTLEADGPIYDITSLSVRWALVDKRDLLLAETVLIDFLLPIVNGAFGGSFKRDEAAFWSFLGKHKKPETLERRLKFIQDREAIWFKDHELVVALGGAERSGFKAHDAATEPTDPFPPVRSDRLEAVWAAMDLDDGDEQTMSSAAFPWPLGEAVALIWQVAVEQGAVVNESGGIHINVQQDHDAAVKVEARVEGRSPVTQRLDISDCTAQTGEGYEALRRPLEAILDWVNNGAH
jgi:hypothetical protein